MCKEGANGDGAVELGVGAEEENIPKLGVLQEHAEIHAAVGDLDEGRLATGHQTACPLLELAHPL